MADYRSHWGIGGVKKLLQTIQNSKCALYNNYTIIVLLLTSYFIHADQTGTGRVGRVEDVDVDEGVEGGYRNYFIFK